MVYLNYYHHTQATLLLLDTHDTFLCPAEHLPYLAARCAKATLPNSNLTLTLAPTLTLTLTLALTLTPTLAL